MRRRCVMKKITIVPSDEDIKEFYELKKKLKLPDLEDWKTFYKKHKKPLKARLF